MTDSIRASWWNVAWGCAWCGEQTEVFSVDALELHLCAECLDDYEEEEMEVPK